MQNIMSGNGENQTLSSSSEPILMKPDNGQSKKVSDSQNVLSTTIKQPYGSMSNLTQAITTGGDSLDPSTDCRYGTAYAGFH